MWPRRLTPSRDLILPRAGGASGGGAGDGRRGAGLHRPRRDGRADLRQSRAEVGLPGGRLRPARRAARRLAGEGVAPAARLEAVGEAANVVFLSLPGGEELAAVGARLLPAMRAGSVLVDLSTAPVDSDARARREVRGARRSAMPTRRSRAPGMPPSAASSATMVGATAATFARIEPLLRCFASDVLHCGEVGTGQVAKLMNNMVLFEIGQAIAEALAIGRRSGDRARGAARGAEPGLGRQLRAAQSWHEGDAARRLSRARVLDALRAEGPRTMRWRSPPRPASTPGRARWWASASPAAIAAGDGERYWPVIAEQIAAGG